jgi:hypothetical protein
LRDPLNVFVEEAYDLDGLAARAGWVKSRGE